MRTVDLLTGRRRGAVAAIVAGFIALSGLAYAGIVDADHQGAPPHQPAAAPAPRVIAGPMPPSRRQPPTTTPPKAGPVIPAAAPVGLAIPAIGVRSPLQHLGLNADGSMEVPAPGPRYNQAGWYRYSPTPGSLGPAVIVGHLDSAAEGPSVFFRLAKVRPRDTVMITRADGSVAVFAVDEVRSYPKRRFPAKLVYGNTDHAALRLITCGGRFDRGSGHYVDNVIVFASLVGATGTRPATGPEPR